MALAFAPAVYAQAESNPDHFTETGVEVGPGGYAMQSGRQAAAQKQAKNVKRAEVAAVPSNSGAPVHVALAVADKNRPAAVRAPKR
jgi:hypothetical protein